MSWMDDNDPQRIERERVGLQMKWRSKEVDLASLSAPMRFVGVPAQLSDRRLGDFTDGRPYSTAEFIRSCFTVDNIFVPKTPGLVLVGPPGTGKSAFAAAVVRKMMSCGYCARFITVEQFSRFHTDRIDLSKNAAQYEDFSERMDEWHQERWRMEQVYDVLVIDDIMRASLPQFVVDELHAVVRQRVGAEGCFTVITANAKIAELEEYAGARFGSFIRREMYVAGFDEVYSDAGE